MRAMSISLIAFGVMTGFAILFTAAIYVAERNSGGPDFPKSDMAEDPDENPFERVD